MANEKRRLIDANELKRAARKWERESFGILRATTVLVGISNAPTVDAVEVVRCKDCMHWKPSGSMAGNSEDDLQPIGGCIWANCCRRANDFCSYGERKDNE